MGLTLAGPEADQDKREACIEQARRLEVQLSNTAPANMQATLFLAHNNNHLTFADGRPDQPAGQGYTDYLCRFAIAAALRLDEKIKSSKDDPPADCRLLGNVDGANAQISDFRSHSYGSALALMLFAARRLNGNYIKLDVLSPFGAHVPMAGRAFACPETPAAPAPPSGSANP